MRDAGHTIRDGAAAPLGPGAPGLDARGVLRHLRAGAGLILLCGLAATGAAFALLGAVPPSYTATVELLVDPAGLHVLERDMVDRRPQNDSGISLVESQARVLRSDSVLRRVVRRLQLGDDPDFAPPGWGERLSALLDADLGVPPMGAGERDEAALTALARKVVVRRSDRTLIVEIFVETQDPQKSARVANAVVDAFVDEEAANRSGLARRLSGALGGGLDGQKAAVEDVEARIARYRQEHDLATADGVTLGDQRLGALNQEIVAAGIRTAEARSRLDQARRARPDDAEAALPEMLGSRELQNLRQQYAALSRTAAEIAARLGQRHPALAAQAAQEADLRRQMQREKARIVDSLQQELDRAAASEAAIRVRLDAAKAEVVGNDRAEVGLRELNRERAARREVYEASLRRARELGEQAQIDTSRIRVISPAMPPSRPSWPPPPRLVLPQAFGLGIVVGSVLALWLGTRRERRFAAAREPAFA